MNRNSGKKKKTKNVWSKDIAKNNEESSKTEFHDAKRKDVSRSPSPVEMLSPMKVPKVYTHTPTVKEPSKPHPPQDELEEDLDDHCCGITTHLTLSLNLHHLYLCILNQ